MKIRKRKFCISCDSVPLIQLLILIKKRGKDEPFIVFITFFLVIFFSGIHILMRQRNLNKIKNFTFFNFLLALSALPSL